MDEVEIFHGQPRQSLRNARISLSPDATDCGVEARAREKKRESARARRKRGEGKMTGKVGERDKKSISGEW